MPDKIIQLKIRDPARFGDVRLIAECSFESDRGQFIGGVFYNPKTGELCSGTESGGTRPCSWENVHTTADLDGPHTVEAGIAVVLSWEGKTINGETYLSRARRIVESFDPPLERAGVA
ncbi:hypothetical protein [Nocardia brasiliensis]|uniref:hypothetical protein n=1 Tax=Nocardia brasiliensis TaxID=37326 RepID=UPI002456825B|nr:hypothetical protein [Nocardia brasiliensis]